jgi:hypothetical protein
LKTCEGVEKEVTTMEMILGTRAKEVFYFYIQETVNCQWEGEDEQLVSRKAPKISMINFQ